MKTPRTTRFLVEGFFLPRPARGAFGIGLLATSVLLHGLATERASAQLAVRDPTQPIAVVNSGGHTAPVRSLIFVPPDGSILLSGGMDKVVNVWDLRPPHPGLVRTIRPRIWRGPAGTIYAMALSPNPQGDGNRILAVAGFGVEATRGEITLYRFPGSNNRPTGDVFARFAAGGADEAEPRGHTNTVNGLAFHPSGRFLASGSQDGTVRIWDIANQSTLAILRGHNSSVNSLAFSSDGRHLVTGASDGVVIAWDFERRAEIARARPDPARHRDSPAGAAINTNMLAVSPDRTWVVIGRENGDLVRYDFPTLANEALINVRPRDAHGAVESLAVSPDGSRLAAAIVTSAALDPTKRPRVECSVDLWSMPKGERLGRVGLASNLVYACAFSPDGRRLAYAGGDQQAITVKDLTAPDQTPTELAGQGSSLWDVGFAADSRTIGISRLPHEAGGAARSFEDFDLSGRRVAPFAAAELSRALSSWGGWTIRPVGLYQLDVLNAEGRGFRLELHPDFDRRWWSYTLVPPGPGHSRPTVAIGCESGVAFFSLETGRRTRLYAGHSGPVYALAPSPDGKWLVTGSSDQTARFWALAGCDQLAPLGATIERAADGLARVTAVEARGFAEAMGMRAGDRFKTFFIGADAKTPADLALLEGVIPDTRITFDVIRDGRVERLQTTKRDGPALTLFLARDREWVLWAPSGLYETSTIGDRKYLGWHRNRLNPLEPTDYFAFDNFERDLRQPDALFRFLQTADRGDLRRAVAARPAPAAPRAPEQVVADDRLPAVQVAAPVRPAFDPLAVVGAAMAVRVQAQRDAEDQAAGPGLIQRLRVFVDSRRSADIVVNPPAPQVDQVVNLNLNPGRHKVSVVAVNNRGKERTQTFDVITREQPRPAPEAPSAADLPQLVVLTVGVDRFAAAAESLPPIPFAAEDARDVGNFLAAPNGTARFKRVETHALVGRESSSQRILGALKALDAKCDKGELGQGDSVFVMLESHFLSFKSDARLLGNDAASDGPEGPAVPAAELAEALGRLADYGCRVLVFVDGMHEKHPASQQTNRSLNEWARALYHKNVIAFVASIHGPSRRYLPGAHGVFAQAVLTSLNVQGDARLTGKPQGEVSLFDFQDTVTRTVLGLTDRQQHARCYIPDTIPSQAPIFDPPSRRASKDLRASRE